jgi:RHS repeat-associated protein
MTITAGGAGLRQPPVNFLASLLARARVALWSRNDRPAISMALSARPVAQSATSENHFLYTPELSLMMEATASSGTASINHEYLWFAGQPVAQVEVQSDATHYYFNDHLGTPLLTTDSTGTIDWRVEREPYGRVAEMRMGSSRYQPLAFPGQEESLGGSRYNIFRWYRAGWGRYTQADPIGLTADLHLYRYVGGNPVRYSDPRGLETYQCVRPLAGPPGKNKKNLLDFVPWNPLYHQYSCTTDPGTGELVCNSSAASGNPLGSPGRPTKPNEDYYKPEACKKKVNDNKCFEQCLVEEWKKPRPWYGIPMGTDCQEYDEGLHHKCKKKCEMK